MPCHYVQTSRRSAVACAVAAVIICLMIAVQAHAEHAVVVAFDDEACVHALDNYSETSDGNVILLREAWLPAYTYDADVPDADLADIFHYANALWRAGEFDAALKLSEDAPAMYQNTTSTDRGELASELLQLRLAIHDVLGHDKTALHEAVLLLSQNRAATFCQNTLYPEACTLLQHVEASTPIYWMADKSQLYVLGGYAVRHHRHLSVLTHHTDPNRITWTMVQHGESVLDAVLQGSCASPQFWSDGFQRWDELLASHQHPAWMAPMTELPTHSQRLMRIVAPIVTGSLLALSIASTVNLRHTRAHFDRCLESTRDCVDQQALEMAHWNWLRARRQTIGLWSSVGVAGGVAIPLGVITRRNAQRRKAQPHQDPMVHDTKTIDGNRTPTTQYSAF